VKRNPTLERIQQKRAAYTRSRAADRRRTLARRAAYAQKMHRSLNYLQKWMRQNRPPAPSRRNYTSRRNPPAARVPAELAAHIRPLKRGGPLARIRQFVTNRLKRS
jgi:hypothetical protein